MSKNNSDRKSLLIVTFVFFLITLGTLATSFFARGYQISFRKGPILTATGLLSAGSRPKSASVYINDRLITATDDTLNLPPGDYKIKIVKDGYVPWEKDIIIKKELVFQTDAQLFRSVPDLKPLSLSGAINPVSSPDGSRIAYAVASASATRDNGLYLIELTDNPLLVNKNIPRLVATNYPGIDWSKATFEFSPNGRQLLATTQTKTTYLINLETTVSQKNIADVTLNLEILKKEWQDLQKTQTAGLIDRLPTEIKSLVSTESANSIDYNSTDDKVYYLSGADGTLPDHIIDAPPAQSTQQQTRQIKKGNYYVYDIKDDTNYLIGNQESISHLAWIPNSNNLIFVDGKEIKTIEYDSTNKITLFASSLSPTIVNIWPDGSKILTLASPYNGAPENLYTISIK